MTRKAKIAVVLGLVIVIGGVAAMSLRNGNRNGVSVRADVVATRDLVATVTANGWIRPRRSVDIQADLMGRITSLWVAEGDSVKVGQVLLQIDPTEYQAAASRARAAVAEAGARRAQARANLIQSRRALERIQTIVSKDSALISQQAIEDASTRVEVDQANGEAAEHGVAQAQAALREAENRLAKTTIRAPINGIVTRLNVEEGETAIVGTMNNPGSLLLTISDLSVMEAVVRVDETDVPAIALGDSASIEIDAFARQSFTGKVTEIAHSSVVQRKATTTTASGGQGQAIDFEIVITIDTPPSALRPDLSATAQIVTATRADALSIPIIALTVRDRKALQPLPQQDSAASAAAAEATRNTGDQEGVFVIREGKAHFTPVEVGIAGAEHFEVLSGLTPGDSVVAGPYEAIRTLQDGRAVRTTMTEPNRAKQPEASK
jgi:HlyD family secretion protein